MRFSELVRLLEENGFRVIKEKGSIRYYCIYKAKWGMIEHVNLLKERGLPVPSKNPNPKIIIQNEEKLVAT